MNTRKFIFMAAFCLTAPIVASAQSSAANPVVSSAREIFDRQAKFIVAAADEMPAEKYSYRPTPEQWTFAKVISHVAQANFGVCAILSDTTAPQNWKVTETDPKDKLTPALKASLDFCAQVLTNLPDSKLGDTVKFFGGRQTPRARALLELTDDLEDHYSQMASYLRLNGMLPPSAKPAQWNICLSSPLGGFATARRSITRYIRLTPGFLTLEFVYIGVKLRKTLAQSPMVYWHSAG